MKEILLDGAKNLSINLDEKKVEQLLCYADLLVEWNKNINLTAITDEEGIATKHFLDSMSALCTDKVKGKVIDVGTGAGFPGLVLKVANPNIELTLLDSLNKRINFLREVCAKMDIDDVEFIHSRAEDAAVTTDMREQFDTVVSRAVANMKMLSEWCLPFLKVGGYFLALKGPLAEEELLDAKKAISILGGEIEDIFETTIPYTDLHHKIIVVKKVRQTPRKFPRKKAIATKTPIEQCYKIRK